MSLHTYLVRALAVATLMTCDIGSYAQDTSPAKRPPIQTFASGQTGKERLSDKASDEQRMDDCKVPADRRGSKRRPAGCTHDDIGAAPTR
jgi:hypothetical protein